MITSNTKSNHHFKYSILVDSSQKKVWDLLIDVDKWKDWDTELEKSTLSEKFSLGAKGVLTPKKGPKLNFHISELTPEKSYTFITKMPIGALEIKRTIESRNEQTEFTDDIKFTGFLKKFFGLLLGRGFKSVLPKVMQNFKELAEKE